MLVFWEQRLVVLPVPKTGSTAVVQAFGHLSSVMVRRPPQLRHVTVQRYHLFVRPWIEDAAQAKFRVVAVMREPISWLNSWYRYRQRPQVAGSPNSTQDITFDAFVRAWCQTERRPPFAHVGSQERFLRPMANNDWIDRLFRYEQLEEFTDFLRTEVDAKIKMPRANVSEARKGLALSPETEALVRDFARDDFTLYETLKPPKTL